MRILEQGCAKPRVDVCLIPQIGINLLQSEQVEMADQERAQQDNQQPVRDSPRRSQVASEPLTCHTTSGMAVASIAENRGKLPPPSEAEILPAIYPDPKKLRVL